MLPLLQSVLNIRLTDPELYFPGSLTKMFKLMLIYVEVSKKSPPEA